MQFNRNYLYGEDVHYDVGGDGNRFDLFTGVEAIDNYEISVWIDFGAVHNGPIVAGDVIECSCNMSETIDVTGYQTSFGPVVSESPTIVPESVYAQQVGIDEEERDIYALACRDTNGSGYIILDDNNPCYGIDENGYKSFYFVPDVFPEVFYSQNPSQPSIEWDPEGPSLSGWPTKHASAALHVFIETDTPGEYVANYGQKVEGIQVWPNILVSGDISPINL